MRILFVGDLNPYSRTSQRFNALQDLGHEIVGINTARSGFEPGISRDIPVIEKAFEKIGYPKDPMSVNAKVILESISNYDVIWVEKAIMIWPSTLEKIKSSSKASLIFYSNDNLEKRHNQSSYMLKSLAKYDFVITINGYSELFYRNLGVKRLIKIRRSHDKTFLKKKAEISKNLRPAVFIGSFEANRFKVLEYLSRNGIPITVFGNGWPVSPNALFDIKRRPIYRDEFIKEIHRSKLVFNFLRKINDDTSTGRTVEIPALGAFLFSETSEPQKRYFKDGEEAVFFSCEDLDDVLSKCRYYLSNDKQRKDIARAGRRRCIESKYDHHTSLEGILSLLSSWPDGVASISLDK